MSRWTRSHVQMILKTLMLFLIPAAGWAEQDMIITKSGDRLVGEIKNLKRGWLTFEADYADNDFIIDWDKVKYLESKNFFKFGTTDRRTLTGSFRTDPADSSRIIIEAADGPVSVSFLDLVTLESVKTTFWDRLSASFDFGYSLTKANNQQQTTVGGIFGYKSDKSSATVSLQAVNSSQDSADRSRKGELDLSYSYMFVSNWYAVTAAGFETSDEQQLDLRSTIGGGIGTLLVATQRMDLGVSAGVNYVNEHFTESDLGTVNSAEAFGQVEYNAFDIGPVSFLTEASVYPSLTQDGRVRTKVKADLKWELPLNLTFKLSFTHNYDTKPPNEATKTDYVFSTTVGWEL
jgi:putative salt-induced outer membrane protein YdiY